MKLLLILTALLVVGFAANPMPQYRAEVEMKDGVPMYINYQGYLTDLNGNPINNTSPGLAMSFSIYDAESGGSLLWGPQLQTVPVRQGVFNVKLLMNEVDTTVFRTGERRWLQLVIGGQIMTPRTEITSMAYGIHSAKADNADMLDNKHHTDFIWNSTTLQGPANFYISGAGITNGLFAAYGVGLSGNNTPTIYGRSEKDSSFAVYGSNTSTRGTGVAGCGNYDTLFYLAGGSGGAFSARRFGLFAYAHDTNGTGVATMGNRISDTVYTLAQGCGGAFNGTTVGVYGLARDLSGNRAGGYFRIFGTSDSTYAYVAYRYNGQNYKILGDGQVSTVMTTREGRRILFAPEAPQPFFEDFGEGRLVNGHCRVNLDPLFLDCVALDESNPLRVFVTLTDECNGVYVKTDRTGFDVYELKGGRSNAGFYWRVIATRKDGKELRFPVAPPPASEVGVPVRMQSRKPDR
mgnify:CR=1 FL=1